MRIPTATYRLQFHQGFTFDDARRIVPYLHKLGISDLYASPIFTARTGSTHGYDAANLAQINPVLGGKEGFQRLVAELHAHEMGLLLDIVPNHMAASWENPWWWSVMEYGALSPFANYFDVDWAQAAACQDNAGSRLLLPVLGSTFGQALENGELQVRWESGGYFVRYYDHRFPISPFTYAAILQFRVEALRELAASDDAASSALQALLLAASACAARSDSTPPAHDSELFLSGEALKKQLTELRRKLPAIAEQLDENLIWLNGKTADPASFGSLESLLSRQKYRLANWRLATEQANYRRFFDISDLAGLRVEVPEVFEASHREILRLASTGSVTGLRIDHIDGLYDPQEYLDRLQARLRIDTEKDRFYIVVEKILGPGEVIPNEWPVAGTTGYDFSSLANSLFVDRRGLTFLDRDYATFTGAEDDFIEIVHQSKEFAIRRLFTGDLEKLTAWLSRLARADRHASDIPAKELKTAVTQVTAAMPVYRSYTRDFHISDTDRRNVEQAIVVARNRTPRQTAGSSAFAFLRRVLLLTDLPPSKDECEQWLRFVRRWQQFSGPAMAKGLEDTAFFRHTRLISLNAVGGTAEEITQPPDVLAFHAHNQTQRKKQPHALNTTSTHDTKRSGDVSARIDVVSELPFAWARAYRRWRRVNKPLKRLIGGREAPDANEEILLYQTLIGAWPWDPMELEEFRRRIKAFLWKALREAKINSSWLNPDEHYEQAVMDFVEDLLEPALSSDFLADFDRFHQRIAYAGAWNALSQTVLKLTAPGVPDFYQGDELWDFSLTDPDNRRPVDFTARERILASFPTEPNAKVLAGLVENWRNGRIKMYLVARLLAHRQRCQALYEQGTYIPVYAAGTRHHNVFAYLRHYGKQWSLTVVPRLVTQLSARAKLPFGKRVWGRTVLRLPAGAPTLWRNLLTGESLHTNVSVLQGGSQLALRDLLTYFPVAVLAAE